MKSGWCIINNDDTKRYWFCGYWIDGMAVLFDMEKEYDNSFRINDEHVTRVFDVVN